MIILPHALAWEGRGPSARHQSNINLVFVHLDL